MKDFDTWNRLKKRIENKEKVIFCNRREIWWASIGLNIGVEQDGKNELFERPVLVLTVFNKNQLRVAPITSKEVNPKHGIVVQYENNHGTVMISQIKTISSKRLTRKMCTLNNQEFNRVIEKAVDSLLMCKNRNPAISGRESRSPKA